MEYKPLEKRRDWKKDYDSQSKLAGIKGALMKKVSTKKEYPPNFERVENPVDNHPPKFERVENPVDNEEKYPPNFEREVHPPKFERVTLPNLKANNVF